MTLKEKIHADMRESMKAKESARLSALRMLISAITNKEIDLRKKDVGLSDAEVLEVVQSESKKRRDSIEEFKKGGRQDLVDKESGELKILLEYLPPELSDDEIGRILSEAIRETGAETIADFGKAMKAAMVILKGRASGDRVSKMLRTRLGA